MPLRRDSYHPSLEGRGPDITFAISAERHFGGNADQGGPPVVTHIGEATLFREGPISFPREPERNSSPGLPCRPSPGMKSESPPNWKKKA